jgi:hypothetical protein
MRIGLVFSSLKFAAILLSKAVRAEFWSAFASVTLALTRSP